jgi:hypothetical protein
MESPGLSAVMSRSKATPWVGLAALGLCFQLAACAQDQNYPSVAKISDVDNVLTPEERQKTLQDLQKAQQTSGADAAKAIQRGSQQQ